MDDQKIELQFRVDTAQVTAAVKGQQQFKAAIDDTGKAADKAAAAAEKAAQKAAAAAAREAKKAADAADREAKRASDAAEREAKRQVAAEERKAAQVEAIESKYAAAEYRRQVKRVEDAEKAAAKVVANTTAIASGASSAGYRLQVLGQGLDDLQYVGEMGLRPIINNLMQISPAVGIAAIAIDTLGVPAVKALMRAFDSSRIHEVKDGIKLVEDRIKVLSDKPFKFKVEHEELDRLQKQLDKVKKAINEYNALMGKQTEFEAKSGKAVGESIVELPGSQAAVEATKQAYIQQEMAKPENRKTLDEFDAQDKYLKERLSGTKESLATAAANGEDTVSLSLVIAQLEKDIEENQKQRDTSERNLQTNAGNAFMGMVSTAETGKGKEQVQSQQMLARWLRHSGGPAGEAVAAAIEESSPRAMQANEEGEEEFDAVTGEATESGRRATQGIKQRRKQAVADSDAELFGWADSEQGRLDRRRASNDAKDRQAGGLAKMYSGGVLGEDVATALKGGMDEAKIDAEIRKVLAREGVEQGLQSRVAKGIIGNARQGLMEERARNPVGSPDEMMPRQRRTVGKRNMRIRERDAKRAAKLGPMALPKVTPYRGPGPVPSIGTMPELKIEGNDKSVSLQSDMAKSLARIEANTADALRASNVAILG